MSRPPIRRSPGKVTGGNTTGGKPSFGKPAFGKPTFGKPGFGKPTTGKPRAARPPAPKEPVSTLPPKVHASKGGPSERVRQFTVAPDDEGVRLDRWFKRHLPEIGFATISRWARTGQIRVDGKRAAPEDRIVAGQVLRVPPGGLETPGAKAIATKAPLTDEQIERAEDMLLHRDRAAIVINKPPGLATQGGTGTYDHVDGLLDAYAPDGPRPRLVHRLDKDTSGALLVAATPGSAAWFSKRFATRAAKKIYWALIVGAPSIEEGLIELPLAKQPGTGGEKMMVDESEQGQPAKTRYRVIDVAGNQAAWVELQPFTGRTHQLRVHMAAIGHPIVGDGKYGGQEAFLSGSISRKMHLHARRLIIDHPDGTPLDVTAPLPDHFAASLAQLGFVESEGDAIMEHAVAPAPEFSREQQKAVARAHAKQYRKDRRGERRGRADGPSSGQLRGAAGAAAGGGFGKADRPAPKSSRPAARGEGPMGKPVRAAGARAGASAAGKPATGKPSAARPSGPRPTGAPRKGPGGGIGGGRGPSRSPRG
jgi:23S rRNA pseudouridine955/2504/2580 synthase